MYLIPSDGYNENRESNPQLTERKLIQEGRMKNSLFPNCTEPLKKYKKVEKYKPLLLDSFPRYNSWHRYYTAF